MQTNQEQQSASQKKTISYLKFLISLPTLRLAFKLLVNYSNRNSIRGVALMLWGVVFLIWGVLWFVQLPSLSAKLYIQNILDNVNFKKIIKWLIILLILVAVAFTIVGLFDGFIPGLSGKDFFTIMLAPVLH
jgi:uncharacterized membrane protein